MICVPRISFRCIALVLSYLLTFNVFFINIFDIKNAQASQSLLPQPGNMLLLSNSYSDPVLRGLTVDPNKPLNLNFIVDIADKGKVSQQDASKLVKYFLAGLTTKTEDIWVNLSPYEKDRITSDVLAQTDLGKGLLEQDYILKQLSASLTHPETDTGKIYWKTLSTIDSRFSAQNADLSKIWISPDVAQVYEKDNTVLITKASLDVSVQADTTQNISNADGINVVPTECNATEMLLPSIRKEINEGRNFANLRQIYHSLILADWFKAKLKDSFYKHYINKSKTAGINLNDSAMKDKIWQQYFESFKAGAYNYIKKERNQQTNRLQKKQYFSGGYGHKSIVTASAIKPTLGDIGQRLANFNVKLHKSNSSSIGKTSKFVEIIKEMGLLPQNATGADVQTLISKYVYSGKTNSNLNIVSAEYIPGNSVMKSILHLEDFAKNIAYQKKLFRREIAKRYKTGSDEQLIHKIVAQYDKLIDSFVSYKNDMDVHIIAQMTAFELNKMTLNFVDLLSATSDDKLNSFENRVGDIANEIALAAMLEGPLSVQIDRLVNGQSANELKDVLNNILPIMLYASAPNIWFSDPGVQRNIENSIAETVKLQEKALSIELELNNVDEFVDEVLMSKKPLELAYFVDDNGDLTYHLALIQAFLKINPLLTISIVAKNDNYGIDASFVDVETVISNQYFDSMKKFIALGRLRNIVNGPKNSALDLNNISNQMSALLEKVDYGIVLGQSAVESINNFRAPLFLMSNVDSMWHQVITGLYKGALYFAKTPGNFESFFKDYAYKEHRTIFNGKENAPAARITLRDVYQNNSSSINKELKRIKNALEVAFDPSKSDEERNSMLIGRKRFMRNKDGKYVKGKGSRLSILYRVGLSGEDGVFQKELFKFSKSFLTGLSSDLRNKIHALPPESYHITTVDISSLDSGKYDKPHLQQLMASKVEEFFELNNHYLAQSIPAKIIGIDMFEPGILKFRLDMDRKFLDDFAKEVWHYLAQDPRLKDIYEDVPFKPGLNIYHMTLGYIMEALDQSQINELIKALENSFDKRNQINYLQPVGKLSGHEINSSSIINRAEFDRFYDDIARETDELEGNLRSDLGFNREYEDSLITVVVGKPLNNSSFESKVFELQQSIKSQLVLKGFKESDFYFHNGSNLHASVIGGNSYKTPNKRENYLMRREIISDFVKNTNSFDIEFVGVELTPNGGIILKGYDNGSMNELRAGLRGVLDSDSKIPIIHMTIGYILKPFDTSSDFDDFRSYMRTLRKVDIGGLNVNNLTILHHSDYYGNNEFLKSKIEFRTGNIEEIISSSITRFDSIYARTLSEPTDILVDDLDKDLLMGGDVYGDSLVSVVAGKSFKEDNVLSKIDDYVNTLKDKLDSFGFDSSRQDYFFHKSENLHFSICSEKFKSENNNVAGFNKLSNSLSDILKDSESFNVDIRGLELRSDGALLLKGYDNNNVLNLRNRIKSGVGYELNISDEPTFYITLGFLRKHFNNVDNFIAFRNIIKTMRNVDFGSFSVDSLTIALHTDWYSVVEQKKANISFKTGEIRVFDKLSNDPIKASSTLSYGGVTMEDLNVDNSNNSSALFFKNFEFDSTDFDGFSFVLSEINPINIKKILSFL